MQFFRPESKVSVADLLRFRGNRGGIIPMHRALARLRFGASEMLISITTAALITGAWLWCLSRVCEYWEAILTIGGQRLRLGDALRTSVHHFAFVFILRVPYFELEPLMPTSHLWAAACTVVLAIFAFTFVLPPRLIPLAYLLRCVLFVQASALVYFAVFPAQFPYAPADYLQGLLLSGAALIGAVPSLFLLTYYIFPFSIVKKLFLTLLTMGYLAIFLPFQLMLHAVILRASILFMPVLYLVLGMPLDVLIIVAFYAWGMTWVFTGDRLPPTASIVGSAM